MVVFSFLFVYKQVVLQAINVKIVIGISEPPIAGKISFRRSKIMERRRFNFSGY